jgi:cytochrome c5
VQKQQTPAVSKRTAPIGEVNVAEGGAEKPAPEQAPAETAAPATAAASDMGKKVYDGLCTSCHGSGIPGIPQMGDAAVWGPRIAQGMDTLYKHAIEGFTGVSGMMMPPKGGGTNTDDEVKAAVDYMVTNSQ